MILFYDIFYIEINFSRYFLQNSIKNSSLTLFIKNLLKNFLFTKLSQANSIFVQSQTAADFINCTTSVVTTPSFVAKKNDSTSIGKWEATGSLVEPLQIHLPVTPTITSFSTTAAIKSENISSGSTSSTSSSSSKCPSSSSKRASKNAKKINDCILNLHQQHQSKTETDGAGCSRTLPLAWNTAIQHLQQTNVNNNVNSETATLLQIKREPCQVSEVTTSNNLLATTSFSGTPAIIKIEQKSPTTTTSSAGNYTSSCASMDVTNNSLVQQNNGNKLGI